MYSFVITPNLGKIFTGDSKNCQYLAEPIRRLPPTREFNKEVVNAGFKHVSYRKRTHGVAAHAQDGPSIPETRKKRLETDLSREDWIKAAFVQLTRFGPSGLKVDRIAKALGITRGSFYWHFKSAEDLKTAMLTHWVKFGTHNVIELAELAGSSPAEKLAALGQRISSPRDNEYGGILAETAIRDWGRYDADVANAVRSVTEQRLSYVANLLETIGLSDKEARSKANLLYGAMVGLEFLQHLDLADMDKELGALFQSILKG